MEKFKYIRNVTQDSAEIRIYSRIGGPDGVNGTEFANAMAYLQTVTNQINVMINSGGGNVFDAMAIQASIRNSKVPCDTYIVGIAASAAFSIAVEGRKCYMADNGIGMIHNAEDALNEAPKKVIDVFNESIAITLTSRSGKTNEEIVAMMSKETWMNAKDCLKNGFIDEIMVSEKKMKTPKVTNAFEMERIYNEFLTPKIQSMKNINNELNVTIENTDESLVVSAIKTIKAERDAFKIENDALKKEKTDFIEAGKVKLTVDVTAFVNQLIVDKKAKEEEKVAIIANASTSPEAFEFVKNTYAKISNVIPAKVIFDPTKVAANGGTEDRATWDFAKWSQNDPEGLLKIQNEHPADFEKLVKTIKTNGVTSR